MELINSSCGGLRMHFEGYAYRKKRQAKNGTTTWICTRQQSDKCTVLMKSRGSQVIKGPSGSHLCGAPNYAQLEIYKRAQLAKKRAREEETALSQIHTESLGDLVGKGANFAGKLPSKESLKRTLRRQRSAARGNTRASGNCKELHLDEGMLRMTDRTSYLPTDHRGNTRTPADFKELHLDEGMLRTDRTSYLPTDHGGNTRSPADNKELHLDEGILRRTHRTSYLPTDHRGKTRTPADNKELHLDEGTLRLADGTSFLLADDGEEERLVVFCGHKGREILKWAKNFIMDGISKSCSKQFSQIFSIHVDFGRNVHPVVFALLPNKKKETYSRLILLIRQSVPEWNPETVNINFEISAILAIREVLPFANVNGCFFHLRKYLWRKLEEIRQLTEYREDGEIRIQIRMCTALAFLKPAQVQDGWMEIHSEAPGSTNLDPFSANFIEYWLDIRDFPVQMWHSHQRLHHRTTNSAESWDNRINTLLGRSHARINDIVKFLREECLYEV